ILSASGKTASLAPDATGDAILSVKGIDASVLGASDSFIIEVNLTDLKRPSGGEADAYYVKLLSVQQPLYALSASDIEIAGAVPAGFSSLHYALKPFVDNQGVYVLLSRDVAPTSTIALSVARDESSATVTASLSNGASGINVLFSLLDSSGASAGSGSAISSNGAAAYKFQGLVNGTYSLSVSAPGYRTATREITIDGLVVDEGLQSGGDGPMNVTIYDVYDESSNKLTAVRVDNNGTPFPAGGSLQYRFERVGGSPTAEVENPVANDTIFTATGVTYKDGDPTQALFYVDVNNLIGSDGKKYSLIPGVNYKLVVLSRSADGSDSSSTAQITGGGSAALISSDGYVSPTSLVLVTYARVRSGDNVAAYSIARINGATRSDMDITFTLLDVFGNPINTASNNPVQATDANGRADVLFANLPYGKYIVRAAAPDVETGKTFVGYSREIELGAPQTSGGGGCDAGYGALALIAAAGIVSAKRKKN
ncbi:MAG: hypothetical protein LBT08_06985, partial [Synergistaceae bacterium]|nr:hypothetical protein [Synergistaceae bacterium]